MLRATLSKVLFIGPIPIAVVPRFPSNGPIAVPTPGTSTAAAIPPTPKTAAMPPATGEIREIDVPALFVILPLIVPFIPLVVCVPSVTEDDRLVPSVVVVVTFLLTV